jgi:hypothetical protein
MTEHKRLVDNCIHLEQSSICTVTKRLVFNKVIYGKNVKRKKSTKIFKNQSIPSNELNMHKTKKRLVVITAMKDDCAKVLPDLLTSSSRHNTDSSNVVVLLACVLKIPSSENKVWCHDDFSHVKKCKPNIIQSCNHHNSTGYYASFGNKGSYDKATFSSVGQYCTKKKSKLSDQITVNQQATMYEQYCADEISRSVNALSSYLPNIRSIVAPVLQVAFEQQQIDNKDLNLQANLSSSDGCFQSCICINAETQTYHTEHDCTYTMITIPSQTHTKKSTIVYDFLFELTSKQSINIPLEAGVSFIFSGLFLKHRQNKSHGICTADNTFFNIASYGNKKLFYHLRKTMNSSK